MKINDNSEPLMVSIKCLTYNHERFVRKCLEGFVMQKTNFKFEVVIHDDASTDDTARIISEFADKYPTIIKPIYEDENQYSKHNGSINKKMDTLACGKYIALCEGDDYWTDSYKLQKQVDFLESHPDFSMCSHRFLEYDQNHLLMKENVQPYTEKDEAIEYDLNDYVRCAWLNQTLTVMYRTSALDLNQLYKFNSTYDVITYYQILKNGKGCLLPDVMAVYRIHDGGVWSGLQIEKQYEFHIKLRLEIYDIEKSNEAAEFLYNTVKDWPVSRKYMLKNYSLYNRIFSIIYKRKGFSYVYKLFKRSFLHI